MFPGLPFERLCVSSPYLPGRLRGEMINILSICRKPFLLALPPGPTGSQVEVGLVSEKWTLS